jgi:cobalt-precorrin 5A hydrolase
VTAAAGGPQRLVLGLGARSGTPVARLRAAVDVALDGVGATVTEVVVLATVDRRATEHGVRDLAVACGWRLVAVPVAELAGQAVPTPSARVQRALGTGSVAEAAALVAAGPGATLLSPKRIVDGITVAIARPGSTGV